MQKTDITLQLDSSAILYEDNHLLIINKKCGELVQGDITGDKPLAEKAKSFLKEKYNKPGNVFMGVTHRLDRPTSGVVVFAKTGKCLARMNEFFRNKEIDKTYWAVVQNIPEETSGYLENYLKKNTKQNKSYVSRKEDKEAKLAKLHYSLIGSSERFHLLEINLETGRHHQIRAQLSKIGCPIKGDLKYGYKRSNPDGGIHLHAREISFVHPVSMEPLKVVAPTPDESLWNFFS